MDLVEQHRRDAGQLRDRPGCGCRKMPSVRTVIRVAPSACCRAGWRSRSCRRPARRPAPPSAPPRRARRGGGARGAGSRRCTRARRARPARPRSSCPRRAARPARHCAPRAQRGEQVGQDGVDGKVGHKGRSHRTARWSRDKVAPPRTWGGDVRRLPVMLHCRFRHPASSGGSAAAGHLCSFCTASRRRT